MFFFPSRFVSRPPWSPDGAAAPEEGGDGSCGLVKEECAGGSTESWSDLSKRAISFNVLSNADLTTRQSSIDLGTSDEEKEKKTLLAELKPIDDAIAAAAAQAAGSGSGATGSSSMTAVDVAKMIGAVASRYPQNPTRAHKTTARALVAGLGQHAPCGEGCRHLLQQALRNVRVGAPRVNFFFLFFSFFHYFLTCFTMVDVLTFMRDSCSCLFCSISGQK